MGLLKSGDVIQAIVLGFLPGRQVVLDVLGKGVVAWTDLPLVRGELITAVVEADPGGIRLRMVDEVERVQRESLSDTLTRSGIPADGLDLIVARAASGFRLPLEGPLFREVREYLRNHEKALDTGAVPLRKLKREIFSFLAAKARGLPASPRVVAAVGASPETRLGTALSRLNESLRSLADLVGGRYREAITERSVHLGTFFMDLGVSPFEIDLRTALGRCGYGYESKLAAKGHSDWGVDEDLEREDLKGALLSLWSWLGAMEEDGILHKNEPARLGLERSLAWCGQVLDIIEGIQIQNLPSSGDRGDTLAFQLPVVWGSKPGSLFLLFSDNASQFWLDLPDSKCVAGELSSRDGEMDLSLHVSEWTGEGGEPAHGDWVESLTGRIRSLGRGVRVRRVRTPPEVSVAVGDREVPAGRVDLVL